MGKDDDIQIGKNEYMEICGEENSYPIYFNSRGLTENPRADLFCINFRVYLKSWLSEHPNCSRVLILTDRNVEYHQKKLLNDMIEIAKGLDNKADLWIIEPGEESKSLEVAEKIWGYMADHAYSRSDVVIAFGGGVVGDLAGFCASLYMRGISLIQIPTTLLSQIDSSIGGKVGINLPQGKNLVGVFYNPQWVIIQSELIKTLPKKVLSDGLGELIKYAYLGSPELLMGLEYFDTLDGFKNGLEKQPDIIEMMIRVCLQIKKVVVENDFKETSVRRYLNLGHTIGHSLESASRYTMSHGHCVANGCLWVMKLGGLKDEADALMNLMHRFEMPVVETLNVSELMRYLKRDKKSEGEGVYFVIPRSHEESSLDSLQNKEFEKRELLTRNFENKFQISDLEWLETVKKGVKLEWISFDEIESKLTQLVALDLMESADGGQV